MLEFKKLSFDDASMLRKYYDKCRFESCEYSAGIKLFWNRFYHYEYAVSALGSLIIKYTDANSIVFEIPVPFNTDAMDEIDEYCAENEIIPVFSDIPSELLVFFCERYNYFKTENYRSSSDYIYNAEDLKYFKGRRYSGQRNHINKFSKLYPGWKLRKLEPGEKLDGFWDEYYNLAGELSESAAQEKEVAMAMVRDFNKCPGLVAGCIEVNGKIAALSVGEICGETIIIHIEKALTTYEGIYPVIVSEFLKCFANGNVTLVNREEDDADKGLRISKLQYRPAKLLKKYVVLLHNELLYVQKIPFLTTKRLTLDEIRQEDAAAYNTLCLDDERNKYWGYYYRDDLEEPYKSGTPVPLDYFFRIAANDFERRVCINFAVRLEGRFIGEVVIYRFDMKGGAEIGCRIAPDFSGRGYGREALERAADWGIYELGLCRIYAKCFKDNTASFKMLSACMKKTSEDEKFFRFVKEF